MTPSEDDPLRTQITALHEECWGWALACCRGERDTAEEVLHMSYHKVLDQHARPDGRSSFKAWLFAVISGNAPPTITALPIVETGAASLRVTATSSNTTRHHRGQPAPLCSRRRHRKLIHFRKQIARRSRPAAPRAPSESRWRRNATDSAGAGRQVLSAGTAG